MQMWLNRSLAGMLNSEPAGTVHVGTDRKPGCS